MKLHALTSAPADRQALQPVPSPGSPLHLILRRRHREHYQKSAKPSFCRLGSTYSHRNALASTDACSFRLRLVNWHPRHRSGSVVVVVH